MAEPWFDPNLYAWIPGTTLGCVVGAWGALVGTCASKGKAKGLILALHRGLLAISALLLVASIVALATGQPYGVWYGLGLPGLIGLVIIGANTPAMLAAYRRAEERRMQAGDLA